MAQFVIMPRQGQSVESCIITSWAKKVGDTVAKGDILFSYETDKSAFDEVSEIDGVLLKILFEEGEDVPCLENVCIIGAAGEDISSMLSDGKADTHSAPAENETEAETEANQVLEEVIQIASGEKIKISPRAKALALKTNADLLKAFPTGPNGRIIERDVNKLLDEGKTVSAAALEAYLKGGVSIDGTGVGGMVTLSDVHLSDIDRKPETVSVSAVVAAGTSAVEKAVPAIAAHEAETEAEFRSGSFGDYTEVKMPNVRRIIATAMHASLSEMAQLTLNSTFDATAMLNFRASLKSSGETLGLGNITINDMILYAVSRVLLNHRDINANLVGENMRYFSHANIGIAVDTDRGLLVPVLSGADTMTLNSLSANAKKIINTAKSGSISPDLMLGGTFTVTNLGSLGVESFTPVINPPQTAILGVCCITQRIRENGTTYPAMGLSLTFDHRAVDGAPAAKFLSELCSSLENFNLLLAK